ncbi:MAG TPA: acyclic terpene utilization AtuA family protein, partial [Acidimicrobiales bacterium]|nr:acyclic terpene utilization AtuA family protein [Acidimicrobiales bacterium]
IKVVTNAGGLDPNGCAHALAEVAETLGLAPTIAYVDGDDLLPRLADLVEAGVTFDHLETGEPVGDISRFITANAYLGAFGIVEALTAGADIVITGRTTDAAIVCGPAAWHHGWSRDDWDALAGAVVAGHIIECGTQASGGNYSFFTEIDGLAHTGFPWVEIAADGSSVIGKHEDTGGAVTVGTVTSQLLYEVGSPAYLGPDVTARFDTVRLHQLSPDRVAVSGTRGEPPPDTLKVAMNELGGFRTDLNVALTGLDIEAKAQLVQEAFWAAASASPDDIESVTTRLVRTDKVDPDTNEEAVALWRITLKDRDERKVGRALAGAINELALATIPGLFAVGGTVMAKPFGVYRPALVPARLVPQHVVVLGGARSVVDSVAPPGAAPVAPLAVDLPRVPGGTTTRVPLGRVFGTRSGDKGGNANVGVFARSAEAFAWLDQFLTEPRLKVLLPEAASLTVDRYRLANIWSLNFVIHGLLQEGVAASARQDGQAKSLGEWLRARLVDIPRCLVGPEP